MTDVTGFGLLGHGLELARGAKLKMRLQLDKIPLLTGVLELAAQGMVTGASGCLRAQLGQLRRRSHVAPRHRRGA